MNDFTTQLRSIGLSDNESLVFATLVAHSPCGASFLAKKCGFSRSSVYTILGALTAKGLVAETHKNEIKQFVAQDYDSLEQLLHQEEGVLEEKFAALKQLKSTFMTIASDQAVTPEVSFFEGQSGLQKVYLHMLRTAKADDTFMLMRDEFVWRPGWEFIFKADWRNRVSRLKKDKNITSHLLINSSKQERSAATLYRKAKNTQTRMLPDKYKLQNYAQYILGDTVAIMSMEQNNLMGIQIVNSNIANNHKAQFLNIWGQCSDISDQ